MKHERYGFDSRNEIQSKIKVLDYAEKHPEVAKTIAQYVNSKGYEVVAREIKNMGGIK